VPTDSVTNTTIDEAIRITATPMFIHPKRSSLVMASIVVRPDGRHLDPASGPASDFRPI